MVASLVSLDAGKKAPKWMHSPRILNIWHNPTISYLYIFSKRATSLPEIQFILTKEQKTILMRYKEHETIVYLEATAH